MRIDIQLATAILSAAAATTLAQGTVLISFDGPPSLAPGTGRYTTNYTESGASFAPLPGSRGFSRYGPPTDPRDPDNGSSYLRAAIGDSLSVRLATGSPFDAVSVDLAEYSTVLPSPAMVRFLGYRSDGTVVSADFTTDGIIDGTGLLADFQTFYFGPEFSGLTRMEIPYPLWSLDNLVISLPEPPAQALLLLAGAILAARAAAKSGRQRRSGARRAEAEGG